MLLDRSLYFWGMVHPVVCKWVHWVCMMGLAVHRRGFAGDR